MNDTKNDRPIKPISGHELLARMKQKMFENAISYVLGGYVEENYGEWGAKQ